MSQLCSEASHRDADPVLLAWANYCAVYDLRLQTVYFQSYSPMWPQIGSAYDLLHRGRGRLVLSQLCPYTLLVGVVVG